MDTYDVIVVGAGLGGLSSAALLAKQGFKVLVLEASNEWGGCAGKFERGDFRFAAGATLGMGFQEDGVLNTLYKTLNMPLPERTNLPIIMDVHLPDGHLRYWRKKELWYKEISHQFPEERERMIAFYEEIFQVGNWLNNIIDQKPVFPPAKFHHLPTLLKLISKETLRLLPFFTQTVHDRLKKYELLDNPRFIHFINGQLMDSVQTTAAFVPAFLGFAALQTFHLGAYSVKGGLATVAQDLAQFIEANGGVLKRWHPVKRIQKHADHWQVTSKRQKTYTASQLIFNAPLHNLHALLNGTAKEDVKVKQNKEAQRPAWGAFSIYVGASETFFKNQTSLFHQFIDSYDLPLAEGNHFLFSVSDPTDLIMAPKGKRSITMSTHTELEPWWEQSQYETKKALYSERLIKTVSHTFPHFENAIELLLPATPVTFQRFVHREKGKVGGYRPTGRFSWLNAQSIYSGVDGLWFCGDTIFPGAGTLGTVLSGMTVAQQLAPSFPSF